MARAEYISASMVGCVLPALPPGPYSIAISNDGRFSTDTGAHGVALEHAESLQITVAAAPRVDTTDEVLVGSSGGTVITVRGRHFLNTSTLACKFNRIAVPAVFVDSETLLCESPPQPAIQRFGFSDETPDVQPGDLGAVDSVSGRSLGDAVRSVAERLNDPLYRNAPSFEDDID